MNELFWCKWCKKDVLFTLLPGQWNHAAGVKCIECDRQIGWLSHERFNKIQSPGVTPTNTNNMGIFAKDKGGKRELVPAGNYIARCYQMIEIGTITENIQGRETTAHKVQIGWEIPDEIRTNSEGKEYAITMSKKYTLSMNKKANLRKDLASWRGKDFSEEEAKNFDITKLLGKPCMLNVIHKTSQTDSSNTYAIISSITPLPKGMKAPDAFNAEQVLCFADFDAAVYEQLPEFLQDMIAGSVEYKEMNAYQAPATAGISDQVDDDLPF